MNDAEIAGMMNWRGPGAYTQGLLNKIKKIVSKVQEDTRIAVASSFSDEDVRMLYAVSRYMARSDESPRCANDLQNLAERINKLIEGT